MRGCQMKRKTQKIATWIIVGLLSLSLLGGTFYGGWQSLTGSNSQTDAYEAQITTLRQQIEQEPSNVELQTSLGNLYYDYGAYLAQKDKTEQAEEQFKLAVDSYQKALEQKEDVNVYVDMATAAFYAGLEDEAVTGFESALEIDPEHFNAWYNYGIFLAFSKEDYEGAIAKFEAAQQVASTDEKAQDSAEWIAELKEMQKQKLLDKAVEEFDSPTSESK